METGLFAMHGLARLMETVKLVEDKRSVKIRPRPLTLYDQITRFPPWTRSESTWAMPCSPRHRAQRQAQGRSPATASQSSPTTPAPPGPETTSTSQVGPRDEGERA